MYNQSMNIWPYYVKKEDAFDFLKAKKTTSMVVMLGMGLVLVIFQMLVIPKMHGLYLDMGITEGYWQKNVDQMFYGAYLVIGFLLATLFTSRKAEDELEGKLKSYKAGEMIKTSEIADKNSEVLLLTIIGLTVGFLVVWVILPIYSITKSL